MTDPSSPISETLFRISDAIISSARNPADLERYEDMSIKLFQARISVDEALNLAKEGKAVVDIDGAKQVRSKREGNPNVKAPPGFENGLGVGPGEIVVIQQVGDEHIETQGRIQHVIGLDVNELRAGNSDLGRARAFARRQGPGTP